MADIWDCEQCGISFVPRREHARFCSARCRAAWNREHTGDLKAGASALVWSITAMSETIERLTRVRAWDRPRAFAVIGEAVWWITMVDATLTGLRFVRNRIGDEADLAEFIEPGDARPGAGQRRITGWTWKPLPEPALRSLSPRGQAWEMTRYWAYQAQLAGHTTGEIFVRAAEFLKLAAADTPAITDTSVQAGR